MNKAVIAFGFCILVWGTIIDGHDGPAASADYRDANQDSLPHSRLKRSAITFPPNTTFRIVFDVIMPVWPLVNTTNTFLTFDLPFRFLVPSYSQLTSLYNSMGRMEENDIELDHDFLEEHRANEDRRTLLQGLESIFSRFGYEGESCVQRAICELVETPLQHSGLLGKAVNLLLPTLLEFPKSMEPHFKGNRTRRELTTEDLSFIETPVDDKYTDAHRDGLKGQCKDIYGAKCPLSVFTILSH